MAKRRTAMNFAWPFLGAIPIILIGVLEENIVEEWGRNVWTIMMVIAVILVVVLSMLPFLGMMKSMFGGKGYNFFWGSGKLARQVLANGKPATATLVKLGENSGGGITTINDQPLLYLTFLINDGTNPPYEVSFDTIVGRTLLPQLQPGVKLPVKVDPYDKTMVVYDEAGAGEMSQPMVGGSNWTDEDRRLTKEQGLDAMALLKEFSDTGKSENFKLICIIGYDVMIPGEEPYEIRKEIPVPADTVQVFQAAVGKTFKARVHPIDRQKIEVDIRL